MFNYYQPTRLYYGVGRLNELPQIAKRYGSKCFMVSTPDAPLVPLYDRIKGLLESIGIEVVHFDKVQPNPTSEMIEEGFELLKNNPCDFVLAVGGGSSIDSAKALAFTNKQESINWDELFAYDSPYENYLSYSEYVLPIISIPTTSGTGSQVTQAAVVSKGKEKITFYHPSLFSSACILDSELTLTLPNSISAATGFDAFTHAFESYISSRASLYSEQDSLQSMKLIIDNLGNVLKDPKNIEYREKLTMADTLSGRALANSGANAPHPLSELIGGICPMAHGAALAVVFPAFVKHAYEENKVKMDIVSKLFNNDKDFYTNIVEFLTEIGLYKTLVDMNVSKTDFNDMLAHPMLDHLPFGNRAFLEAIMKDSYGN